MEYISIISQEIDLTLSNRYLRLPHPRTNQPQLYLPYSNSKTKVDGICEVVKVSGSKGRTWFINDDRIDAGSILIHHPIDPLFLVIPIILALLPSESNMIAPFQPLSDLMSTASSLRLFSLQPSFTKQDSSTSLENENPDVARLLSTKGAKRAFKACCERKTMPETLPVDESGLSNAPKTTTYFRPSRDLILSHLKAKIDYFTQPEQFEKFDHLVRGLSKEGLLIQGIDSNLVQQAKNKAAIDHVAQYIPPSLLKLLIASYEWTALQTHQANLTAAKLVAAQPIINSKPDSKTSPAGTKRKASASSKGVEALKKVNTRGMSKLTTFFKPKK